MPVLVEVERALLDGRPPRYVQLATAAAPEGETSLQYWQRLGAEAAARLEVEQVALPVVDRDSADDPDLASQVAGAGLIYLSGGDPGYLTRTLRGSAVWAAIVAAWQSGAALAGCSAGAMALSAGFPDIRRPWRDPIPGLSVVPSVEVLPHFDRMAGRLPDLILRRVTGAPAGVRVVGIDEDTALLTENGVGWRVMGRQSVWLLTADGRVEQPTGSELTL
jgi:cyanophycinase